MAVQVAQAGGEGGSESGISCEGALAEDYNMGLAIASVFILLVVSFVGAGFPALLALKRHPYLVLAIKFGNFAGSGVLLATGFVHMLQSGIENLSNPCLSEGWLSTYPAWGILFAVITIVVMQTLDYIIFSFLGGEQDPTPSSPSSVPTSPSSGSLELVSAAQDQEAAEEGECHKHVVCKDAECKGRALLSQTSSVSRPKARSNLMVSEVSVGVHSILIGIALGVTSSSEFTALFIAIIFHQASHFLVIWWFPAANLTDFTCLSLHAVVLAAACSASALVNGHILRRFTRAQ